MEEGRIGEQESGRVMYVGKDPERPDPHLSQARLEHLTLIRTQNLNNPDGR
jgi:hypothetical protein